MAAPLAIAAKVALQYAAQHVQKKYPGGILGLVATIVLFAIFIGIIALSMIVGMMQLISPRTSSTDECIAYASYGGDEPPEALSFTAGEEQAPYESPVFSGTTPSNLAESARVVMPVPDGRYRLTSPYGMRTHPVFGYPKMHYGMDFGSVPRGATDIPILAAADGVVQQSGPASGFGQWVTIEHNINGTIWVTVYGHVIRNSQTVKPGDRVTAGQKIALMGTEGDSTGVHLHFEVWKNAYSARAGGVSTDPAPWLQAAGAVNIADPIGGNAPVAESCDEDTSGQNGSAGPWGGHENGRIPVSELCAPTSNPGHRLRCDAARALDALSAEFTKEFGKPLSITDSYRDYAGQVACQQAKGSLCAVPGTSNHGWALAVDVASNVNVAGTREHKWMQNNASKHGWILPSWAQQGGSKPEPWHWEYVGTASTAAGDGKTPASAKVMAQGMLISYGWSSSNEFRCLDNLWTRESSWNYKAANPSSSARGIPQAMMSAHFGPNWQNSTEAKAYLENPSVQISWGLDYIKRRYSSPCAAWAHSESKGWY